MGFSYPQTEHKIPLLHKALFVVCNMKTLKLLACLSFLSFISSCVGKTKGESVSNPFIKELKRISSPDKKVDAVLIEREGGATVANSNRVFLVLPGKKVTEDDLDLSQFTADHTQNVDIEWEHNQQLLIKYEKARIFNFSNFWQAKEVEDWNHVVELRLQCTSTDGQLSETDKHPMKP